MKITILYHQVKPGVDCPDGVASAWVAHRSYSTNNVDIDVIGCVYQEEPTTIDADKIIIVDFSFPRNVIQSWLDCGIEVILIDHHKTALEHLGDVSSFSGSFTQRFDMYECGATLTWKYFYNNLAECPAFLGYVKDRDLWNFELPQSEEIHEAMSDKRHSLKMLADDCGINTLPLLFAFYDEIAKLSQDELIAYMGSIGEKLLAPKREKITLAANRATLEYLPETQNSDQPKPYWQAIPIVRCKADGTEDRLVSDICAKLYREHYPDSQFVGCITSDGKYSLRSNKNGSNYDVSLIAKFYGGGGHRNAAGFAV